MQAPQFPPDEAKRLATLRSLNILDTPFEERFDRITRTAQNLFKVPFALISLIDAERQWFKSCQGLDASETSRDISFCGHAILDQNVFLVPNALNDPRFADNPLVTGAPHIRFYAGQPLRMPDGSRIGTLCVIDTAPRDISEQDLQSLRDLACWAEQELGMMDLKNSAQLLATTTILQRTILDSANYSIISTDTRGLIQTFNSAAERLLGYSADEVVGKVTPAIIHDSNEVAQRAPLLSAELGMTIEPGFDVFAAKTRILGVPDENEWTYVRKDGSRFPVLLSVTAIRNEAGKVTGYLGVAADLTERKQALAEIERRDQRYRTLVDSSPDAIYINQDDVFTYLNPAAVRLFGAKEKSELLGKSVLDRISVRNQKAVKERIRILTEERRPVPPMEQQFIRLDGQLVDVEVSASPYSDDMDTGMQVIVRDITERKATQAALLENEQKLRSLFELSPLGIALTDMAGHFVEFNAAFLQICGYSAKELKALDYWALTPREYEAQEKMQLDALTLTGRYGPYEKEYLRKDGSRVPLQMSGVLVSGQDGQKYIWSIVADIAERKKIDRMKNEFIFTVSHELRTPLTSIRGSLGLILGGVAGEMSAQARSLLDIAYGNSERLVRLINDILDIERIESGKMKFDPQPQLLMPLINHAIEANRSYGMQYEVSLQLVSGVPDVMVNVDHDRFVQVMSNLLSNAAKYSPAKGQVDIAATQLDGRLRVTVTDHGDGIPEEFRDRIFHKFSRADSTDARQKGGSGLGLSIAKSIVEEMGGQIGFDSQAGVGSSFYFEFPAWRESDVMDQA